MAFRDLGRNKRRSLLSALAVAMGMSLLLLMASVLAGEMRGAMQNTIALQSGHLQVRAASYDENKVSLAWEDLIENPADLAAQIKSIPQVVTATPRLFASGIVTLGDNSRGVQVIGFDPDSPASEPIRKGLIAGDYLKPDDREGVLIGKPLADKFGLQPGSSLSLLVNTSNGTVDEQPVTVRGIYSTKTPAYDEGTLFMPLAKAQTFTGAGEHASTLFILLQDREQAEAVAAAIQSPGYQVLTWRGMNELIVQTEQYSSVYLSLIYLIVLGITATVVTNTLIMAVFERTREIGILSAIGMKARRVMAMFLTEAGLLATGGVIGGLILGGIMVWYFTKYGFYIGNIGLTGILMGERIYSYLTLRDTIMLSLVTYIITLVASLYPALMAARMEPVEALHGTGD
jgi:ABC-type lipoprotein release transport system permease subunit